MLQSSSSESEFPSSSSSNFFSSFFGLDAIVFDFGPGFVFDFGPGFVFDFGPGLCCCVFDLGPGLVVLDLGPGLCFTVVSFSSIFMFLLLLETFSTFMLTSLLLSESFGCSLSIS